MPDPSASIPRRASSGAAPLSLAQARWWFLDQLEPDTTPLHNWSRVIRWIGPLEVGRLARSFEAVVARHEALRTRFPLVDGVPVQEAVPAGPFALPVTDLTGLPAQQREDRLRQLALAEVRRPFDLLDGRLLRGELFRLGPEEHVLVLVIHHITSDGWSMQVLLHEVAAVYASLCRGGDPALPDLPIQYADYAAWQRAHFQGAVLDRELAYWRDNLLGAPPVLSLPLDHQRPQSPTYAGTQYSFDLPSPLAGQVLALARRERVTPFMVLLAAFKAVLWRCTGEPDLVVGTPVAGRTRLEMEHLIGSLANALALRTDLSGNPTLRELLRRVRDTALGAFAHQELPFEYLVEALQPDRTPGQHPLFQIMFNYREFPPAAVQVPGVRLEDLQLDRGTALFDLSLAVVRRRGQFRCGLSYRTDLFEATTIERLAERFRRVLEAMVADPDRRLADVSFWSEAERHRLLVEWNGTARSYPTDVCLHRLFEAQVRRTPHAIALAAEGQQLTYAELERRANRLARRLRALGIGAEVRVGLCLERSVEMVVGLLAVLKAGGAYVPLDPTYPRDRLAYMLADAQVEVVLTSEPLRSLLAWGKATLLCLPPGGDGFPEERSEPLSGGAGPDNLAYVIYTSGSTGWPKGVMVCHRSVANHLGWRREYFPLDRDDRGLHKASLGFDDSVWELFEPLLAGARVVLARPGGQADSRYLMRLIEEQGVTTACFVPSLLRVFLEEPGLQRATSLRRVTTGGEALSLELQGRYFDRLGVPLYNGYGPTEATISATFWKCDAAARRASVPIGRPIGNTTVYLLDADFRPVPLGAPGELCIGGLGVARGYLGRPGLTADRFIPDPFAAAPGARVYRTGDRARYLADGTLEFLGRTDDQVKLRGNRVELAEIETVLRSHQAVSDAAVVAREDASGGQQLVAYFVPADSSRIEATAEHLSHWRGRYEDIYRRPPASATDCFNTAGWISSYTDEPIPAAQMREWTDHTVERILQLRPRRVLEIGCGTGLLLLRVAPHCERYVGTDFSAAALEWLTPRVRDAGLASKVSLLRRDAHDFTGLAGETFDLVILNSVIQYFPDLAYLLQVLAGATGLLGPDGAVFIGDVRNFALLEAFHASVELCRAPAGSSAEELWDRTRRRVDAESELTVASGFFASLPRRLPRVREARVMPKRGRADNEMTRFRYDVVLGVEDPGATAPAPAETDWVADSWDWAALRDTLAVERPDTLAIRRVPNARVVPHVRSAARLRGQVEGAEQDGPAIHPEDLHALAAEHGYEAELSWLGGDRDGRFDALFWRSGTGRPALPGPAPVSGEDYANLPLSRAAGRGLAPQLRRYLASRLPEFMIPQTFVALERLPLTPSGKLNRQALPRPDGEWMGERRPYVAPGDETEVAISEIWSNLLKIRQLGVHDNFFELGGHSLLATLAVARMRERLAVDLPLRALFESPTVAGLAAVVARQRASSEPLNQELLDELDRLSDEEVERLLAAERGDPSE